MHTPHLISVSIFCKATQAYGQEVVARETEWKEEATDSATLLRRQREEPRPLSLYGSLDGTSVHIRREQADAPGLAAEDPWRELKMGAYHREPPAAFTG